MGREKYDLYCLAIYTVFNWNSDLLFSGIGSVFGMAQGATPMIVVIRDCLLELTAQL